MTERARILVVDDDPGVVDLWTEVLCAAGYRTVGMTDPRLGLRRALEEPFDLVLCDVQMPQMRGTELLERLVAERPRQLVVMITAFGSIEAAVSALQAGAADFVSKPCSAETLLHVVGRALRERQLRREVVRLRRRIGAQDDGPAGMVAQSAAMKRALELARRVARASGPVLLQGESGTGKTLLAQYIHEHSDRASQAFVAVNASTLPEQIAEAELFGVKRGAYTDAVADREGLLRRAHRGTVFLDEVVELPLAVQAKLLTVVEGGRLRPVGGARDEYVDLRLIAASNRALSEAVNDGQFRADLRYRLDVLTIHLPPLRERGEDLTPLVELWLDRLAERHGRETLGISAAGWRWLHAWHWPGNVRELINRLERAIVFSDHDFLGPEDFADPVATPPAAEADAVAAGLAQAARLGLSAAELEQRYLLTALRAASGNKTEAARILGIDRRTLYRKLDDEALSGG